MTNRDLLKEAIADAKAVKETAIANAKAALEESFGPFLTQTLATKLMEMDNEELKEVEEMDDLEETLDEDYAEDQPESKEKAHHIPATKEAKEEDGVEETLDLEELLKELDAMSNESINEDQTINGTDADEIGNKDHGNIVNMKEEDEVDMTIDADSDGIPDEMDADVNIEEMSTEDLEAFIKEVIADMVKDGELEAGHEDMGEEKDEKGREGKEDEKERDMDELDEMGMYYEEKDEKMEEMKKELEEAYKQNYMKLIYSTLNYFTLTKSSELKTFLKTKR